jgi:hypothetical protein
MVLEFVYETRTESIPEIPQLIFGLIDLLILTRFIWPLQLPLSIKVVISRATQGTPRSLAWLCRCPDTRTAA